MIKNQNIILCGGGEASQTYLVDEFFSAKLKKNKILFLPQACSPEMWSYKKALNWLVKRTAFSRIEVIMCENIMNIDSKYLEGFDAIYIMGGNTFKLLKVIREAELEDKIIGFLKDGKIVYGLSAGAIVLGANIYTATSGPEKDSNIVNITNLKSLNFLNGFVVATHYIEDMDKDLFDIHLKEKNKIIAIPETSGVYVKGSTCTVLGYDPITLFESNKKMHLKQGTTFELI